MSAKLTIECPSEGCGRRYDERQRASLISPLSPDGAAVEVNRSQASTTSCPSCGRVVELGLLVLDDDGVWRVSRFAGRADDVIVMRPPGGSVSYRPSRREPIARASGLSADELKTRERALAAVEGRARGVAMDVRREAVELAIDAGVLNGPEAQTARAWLDRGDA